MAALDETDPGEMPPRNVEAAALELRWVAPAFDPGRASVDNGNGGVVLAAGGATTLGACIGACDIGGGGGGGAFATNGTGVAICSGGANGAFDVLASGGAGGVNAEIDGATAAAVAVADTPAAATGAA